ncbi:MAG TPA: Si-specific NAD(P)(+) transhydrogenase, partial [Actinomycetota bacterium]|nr:Si-specific NAD(P)(+) transhydrogenase [Actinomycetota bacterium]
MTESYDLVVVGSGPAGEKGAARAAYFGARVAVVERAERPGGAAVRNAGIPTKTLRETALYVTGGRKRDVYGVSVGLDRDAAFAKLRERTAAVVDTMGDLVTANLARHGITLVRGDARLAPGRVVVVATPDGDVRELAARAVLLAPGSRPARPRGFPFDDPCVHDSETLLELERPPERLVVVGAGAIACEYASIFGALGVRTSLVARHSPLVPFLDREISELLAHALVAAGVDVVLDAGDVAVERRAGELVVGLEHADARACDAVLVAVGRAGNVEGLGLADAGVDVDARGRIVVDGDFRTTAEGVYAAGDVVGAPQLASVSMEQGRTAVAHALSLPAIVGAGAIAPYGVYSIPEAAMAGATEQQARADGIDYEVGRAPFARNARANIAGLTDGIVKLVFRRDDLRLLGVHALGDDASELVHVGQTVMQHGGTVEHFVHATYNVPTRTEAYKYAAYDGLARVE